MTFIELWFILGFIALGIQMGDSGHFTEKKGFSAFYDGVWIIILGAISFGCSLEDIPKESKRAGNESDGG